MSWWESGRAIAISIVTLDFILNFRLIVLEGRWLLPELAPTNLMGDRTIPKHQVYEMRSPELSVASILLQPFCQHAHPLARIRCALQVAPV